MKNLKQLGIYMDHSSAFLLELTNGLIIQNNIASESTHEEKEISLQKNERLMHNKEQQQQSKYYENISDQIRNFQEVILFGPTDAKNELFNLLKDDHLFSNIKIVLKDTDAMTEIQKHTFVKEYFK